jgi:hypothetical protein
MDSGQIELSDLSALIAQRGREASFVAVAGRDQGSVSPLWRAEIVIGSECATMPERVWQYEECTFVSATLPVSTVCGMLEGDESRLVEVATVGLAFSLFPQCNYEHKPTRAQHDNPRLPWPSTTYTLSLVQPPMSYQPPGGLMVGPRSPSFVTFGASFNAFFFDNFTLTGSNNPSFGQFIIRDCDERGRIQSIKIGPTHLEVEVGGNRLAGASLELMATTDRVMVDVPGEGSVRVPIPNGLPSDARLWLRSNTEWYDYRPFDGYGGYRATDIHDERPTEPAVDVAVMIAQGENEHVEFKEQLPSNTSASRRTALKTIVALANTGGGTMLYGVDDDGLVCGLPMATQRTVDGFMDTLRSSTSPMPSCRSILHEVDGKSILVVEVDASSGAIYALTVEATKHEFYVRRGATTFRAQSGELQAVAGRGQQQQSLGIFGSN